MEADMTSAPRHVLKTFSPLHLPLILLYLGIVTLSAAGADTANQEYRQELNPAVSRLGVAEPGSVAVSAVSALTVTAGGITEAGSLYREGALSGLAADEKDPLTLYAVADNFIEQPQIYTLRVDGQQAEIVEVLPLVQGRHKAYDLEGVATRAGGGFWVVSEGRPGKSNNLLLSVSADGVIEQEIDLPADVRRYQTRHGFEGVTVMGNRVIVVFQREWKNNPRGLVTIGAYDLTKWGWSFFYYPLDEVQGGNWSGLSAIAGLPDGSLVVIERDKWRGARAQLKRIYRFHLRSATEVGLQYPVVRKKLFWDLRSDSRMKQGDKEGKLEGLAMAADGTIYLVTDNDGRSEPGYESTLFRLEYAWGRTGEGR